MTALLTKSELVHNPLDIAEMVLMDKDWAFDRPGDEELVAEVAGAWCSYRVWFTWQEELGGLTLSCAFETKTPVQSLTRVHSLLSLVNEKIWIGHFELPSDDHCVTFRHSLLLRDGAGTTTEQLQDLLDIAIEECERFYPAFQSVAWGGKAPAEALQLALFETIAEA